MKQTTKAQWLINDLGTKASNLRAALILILWGLAGGVVTAIQMEEWWPILFGPIITGLYALIFWIFQKIHKAHEDMKWRRFEGSNYCKKKAEEITS